MTTDAKVEAAAKAICRINGINPNALHQAMPGDKWDRLIKDGLAADDHFINSRGERCKLVFAWRHYGPSCCCRSHGSRGHALAGRRPLPNGQFVAGVPTSASDQGTSVGLMVPDSLRNLDLWSLNLLKTPYGQAYLRIAQAYGPNVWGLS